MLSSFEVRQYLVETDILFNQERLVQGCSFLFPVGLIVPLHLVVGKVRFEKFVVRHFITQYDMTQRHGYWGSVGGWLPHKVDAPAPSRTASVPVLFDCPIIFRITKLGTVLLGVYLHDILSVSE